uniref:Uncharacterized protein n=1 Tax=Timema genevievae TaxID=629358 RepID=A0A7R9JWR5_TIMGE|nr:unnamed protein product [Timema genevievae]
MEWINAQVFTFLELLHATTDGKKPLLNQLLDKRISTNQYGLPTKKLRSSWRLCMTAEQLQVPWTLMISSFATDLIPASGSSFATDLKPASGSPFTTNLRLSISQLPVPFGETHRVNELFPLHQRPAFREKHYHFNLRSNTRIKQKSVGSREFAEPATQREKHRQLLQNNFYLHGSTVIYGYVFFPNNFKIVVTLGKCRADPGTTSTSSIRLDSGLGFGESLQVILDELHGYHELQEQWIKLQGKLLWERVPLETKRLGQDQSLLSSMLTHSVFNLNNFFSSTTKVITVLRIQEMGDLICDVAEALRVEAKKLNKDLFLLGDLDEGVLSSVSSKLPSSPWLTEMTNDYQEFEDPSNDPLSLMLDETPLDHYQPYEQQADIPSTMPPDETVQFSENVLTLPPDETVQFSENVLTLPPDETVQFSENVLTMPPDETIQASDDPSTISKRESNPISQGITNLNHPRPSKNPSTLLQGGNTLAYHEPTRSPYYPTTMQLGEVVREEPTRTECAEFVVKFPSSDIFPSVFLPPENKGFEVSLFLGELLNIGKGAEHELPWYPPLCTLSQHSKVKHYLPTKEQELVPDDYLRIHLLRYVNEGKSVEAEIGQRILSALIKMTGPSWLLQTLASLYWRVRGNLHNAMECLYVALSSVPNDYRDVVQVSLGSLLNKVGHTDEALHRARDALDINNIEPATHFLLASLYSTKGNFSGAAHHLKQVLRVDPDFISEGLAEHLLLVMLCREKFSHHLSRLDTEETCGASIPGTASSITNKQWTIATGIENLKEGETLICSPDGEQCRSVQCFSVNPDSTSAKILALKSLAQEQCGGIPLLQTNQDELHDETELEQMVDEMEEEEVGSLLEMNKLLDQITMSHNESVIDINGKQNPLATVLFHNETRICMAIFTTKDWVRATPKDVPRSSASYRCEPGREEDSASYHNELSWEEGSASYHSELGREEGLADELGREEGLASYRSELGREEGLASYHDELGREEGSASYRREPGRKKGYDGQLRREKANTNT